MNKATLACALLICTAGTASADPVTVTGGSVIGSPFANTAKINLTGDGFSLTLADDSFTSALLRCTPCSPERPITLGFSSTDAIDNEGGGPGEFNGTAYPQTFFNGNLSFVGPTFSSAVLSPTTLTVTAPFTLTGTLIDYASSRDAFYGGPPVFTAFLNGSGTATAQFSMDPFVREPQLFDVQSVVYRFGASPTPEPASILLLGTGLIAVVVRSRRQRRDRRPRRAR